MRKINGGLCPPFIFSVFRYNGQNYIMEPLNIFTDSKPEGEADRERRAKVLLRLLHNLSGIEAFGDEKFEAIFSNEQHKRDFIEGLNSDSFLQLLNGLNGILRDREVVEWNTDGENVSLQSTFFGVGYLPPRQEDKLGLLVNVLKQPK